MKTSLKALLLLTGPACAALWMLHRPLPGNSPSPGPGRSFSGETETAAGPAGRSLPGNGGAAISGGGNNETAAAHRLAAAGGGAAVPDSANPLRSGGVTPPGREMGSLPEKEKPLPPSGPPTLSLAERALRVENDANRELQRLVPLLNLTEDQQDKVFERLARNSVYWSGGLTAGSGGGKSSASGTDAAAAAGSSGLPSDAVRSIPDLLTETSGGAEPLLTPEQEEAMLNDDLERREWWSEVVTLLQSNLGIDAATAGGDSAAAAAVAADSAASGSGAAAAAGITTPAAPVSPDPLPAAITVEGAESVVD